MTSVAPPSAHRFIVVVVLAVVLTGCSSGSDGSQGSTTTSAPAATTTTVWGTNQPMLTWSAEGGLCADGEVCKELYVVLRDGTWTRYSDSASGQLPDDVTTELLAAVDDHGASLRDLPAKAERSCASWADGSDIVLSAVTATGETSVSSCDVTFDETNPVVAAWQRAVAAIG